MVCCLLALTLYHIQRALAFILQHFQLLFAWFLYSFQGAIHIIHVGSLSYEFETTNCEWLWFIAQNRRPVLAKQLAGKVDSAAFDADVIIGKIANDKTNATIIAYLNGLYGDILSERAVSFAIEELMPNKLEDQFCFLTQKAVNCLEFVEDRKYAI